LSSSAGRKIESRPKEWGLLEYLMGHAGKVVSCPADR